MTAIILIAALVLLVYIGVLAHLRWQDWKLEQWSQCICRDLTHIDCPVHGILAKDR